MVSVGDEAAQQGESLGDGAGGGDTTADLPKYFPEGLSAGEPSWQRPVKSQPAVAAPRYTLGGGEVHHDGETGPWNHKRTGACVLLWGWGGHASGLTPLRHLFSPPLARSSCLSFVFFSLHFLFPLLPLCFFFVMVARLPLFHLSRSFSLLFLRILSTTASRGVLDK